MQTAAPATARGRNIAASRRIPQAAQCAQQNPQLLGETKKPEGKILKRCWNDCVPGMDYLTLQMQEIPEIEEVT